MWVKDYLTNEENEYYKKFEWYYEGYEKFSSDAAKIITEYKNGNQVNMSTLPPYLGFSLTYQCNLKCPMCFQDRKNFREDLSLTEYSQTAMEIGQNGNKPWVTLWGGEPTLHPKFEDIYHAFLPVTSILTICTNGTRLHRFTSLFSEKDAHTLWVVSIDGMEKMHDSIRGSGNYHKTVSNLSKAIEIRNHSKSQHMFAVEVTLLKENKKDIIPLIKELVDMGVDWIALNHLWFLSKELIDIYEEELKNFHEYRYSPMKNMASGFHTQPDSLVDPLELYEIIQEAKLLFNNKIHILEMPTYKSKAEIKNHYNYHRNKKEDLFSCYENQVKLDFNTEGAAVICKQYPDLTFGSLRNNSLNDIWFSVKRKDIIEELLRCNSFSVCHMCPDRALSVPYNKLVIKSESSGLMIKNR